MHEPIGSTDALFGADGTQLPDPPRVLPDALTGPGLTFGGEARVPSPVRLSAAPDAGALREAVAAALAEDPAPPPPSDARRGHPARRPAQRSQPDAHHPPAARYPQRGRPYPPVAAAPRTVQPAPSGGYRHPRAQRPLGERPRSGRGSRTGCVITLIFLVVVAVNLLGEFTDLVSGLFR